MTISTPNPLPGTTISELPVAVGLSSFDYVAGIQGGTTKRFPVPLITSSSTLVGSTIVTAAGDYDQKATDQVIYLTGANTRNVNLLPAASVAGHLLWVKVDINGATNTQRIVPDPTVPDLIEGLDHLDLAGSYQWVLLYPLEDGTWLLFT